MAAGDEIRGALSAILNAVMDYPAKQLRFFKRPDKFVANLDLASWAIVRDAFGVLALGSTIALVIQTINIRLYGERIRRVIEVPGKTEAEIYLVVVVAAFAVLSYVPFRALGGRAKLVANGAALMYAIGFSVPVATLLLVVLTRLASVLTGAVLVLRPPFHIVELGYAVPSSMATVSLAICNVIVVLWNVYFTAALWLTLCSAHRIDKWRGAAAFAVSVGLLALLSRWLSPIVKPIVELLAPILEWIL